MGFGGERWCLVVLVGDGAISVVGVDRMLFGFQVV